MPSPPEGALVRAAHREDTHILAEVLTRAFAHDPSMNWFGSMRPGADARPSLAHFQLVLVKMATLSGLVTVATVPDGEGKEKIVGGALWLMPGQSMDPSPLTFMRMSPWKAVWHWGYTGLSRMLFKYTPTIEKSLDNIFGERGLKRLDSWHLFEIGIDPDYEGKGLCSLLIRDGFTRASPKPVHLEATSPKSRDRYLHLGFELNKEHRFGVGEVDDIGIATKGEAAVGWPDFIMTKWQT